MLWTPKEYQREILAHGEARDEAAFFVGMGLGKTVCMLELVRRMLLKCETLGVLVVAPLNVAELTWPLELAKWSNFEGMKIASLRTPEGVGMWRRQEAHIYTINYESLHYAVNLLRRPNLPVDTIVWDELSRAKSGTSSRTKPMLQLRHKFQRHWGLTGTPASEDYVGLFPQCRLLDGGKALGSLPHALDGLPIGVGTGTQGWARWQQGMFTPENPKEPDRCKLIPRPGTVEKIQKALAPLALAMRREDYLEIPPTDFIDIDVEMPKSVWATYRTMKREMITWLGDDMLRADTAGVLSGKLRQILSGAVYGQERQVFPLHTAKQDALRDLHASIGHQPMLVLVQWQHEFDILMKAFPDAVHFYSGVGKKVLGAWNNRQIPLLFANPASVGHGLNLQDGGHHTCWYSLPWSGDYYDQANARLARMGQGERTKVFRLIVKGSADEAVAEALRHKADEQDGLFIALRALRQRLCPT